MKRIIINGANGYVASNFINELLLNNYEVIALVRKGKKQLPKARMEKVLAEINEEINVSSKNLKVYDYALLEENFSLTENLLIDIFSHRVDYFHFAASLKYDFKSKDEILETNLVGVVNSLNVFTKFSDQNSRFFFISTAYSCGRISEPFKEQFYNNENISVFRNYYEQSKRLAENVVREYINAGQINGHILRLSQVVGNNKTGITKTDYGIFDFAKRICNLANKYPNQTVRIRIDPDSTQNLISIDTVTNYLLRVTEIMYLPLVINVVAKKSIQNIHIIDCLNKLLPIKIVTEPFLIPSNMNVLERMISMGMSFTGSYSDINILFETKNLDFLFSQETTEVTEQTVFQMMDYYLNRLAGKKKRYVCLLA